MNFFDRLKDTVSVADVSQKISDTTTTLKLKNQIRNNEKEIDKLTYQAGCQLVSQHLNDEDSEYKEIFQDIKRLQTENSSITDELQRMREEQEKLQQMKEEQAKLKRIKEEQTIMQQQEQKRAMQESLKTCTKCGCDNAISAKFCVYCGNPLTETSNDREAQMKAKET